MTKKSSKAILLTMKAIGIPFLLWLGSPAQEYLEKLPPPISVRLLAVLLLTILLLYAYILFLRWEHRLIPIHGLLRDNHWEFFCPACDKPLAYRDDTPQEPHHFHCH